MTAVLILVQKQREIDLHICIITRIEWVFSLFFLFSPYVVADGADQHLEEVALVNLQCLKNAKSLLFSCSSLQLVQFFVCLLSFFSSAVLLPTTSADLISRNRRTDFVVVPYRRHHRHNFFHCSLAIFTHFGGRTHTHKQTVYLL